MTPTNINFTPQKYAGAVGLDRSPSPGSPALARKLALAGTVAQPCKPRRFAPLQERKHGWQCCAELLTTQILRFVGFIRFIGLNSGHVQLLRFINVMVRSYSFGHLDSVK